MWCYQVVIYGLVQSLCGIVCVCVCVCVYIYIYFKDPSIVLWVLYTTFVLIMFGKTSVVYAFRNTWNACFYSLIFHIRWATSKPSNCWIITTSLSNFVTQCLYTNMRMQCFFKFLYWHNIAKKRNSKSEIKKTKCFFFSLRVLIIARSEEEK